MTYQDMKKKLLNELKQTIDKRKQYTKEGNRKRVTTMQHIEYTIQCELNMLERLYTV